MTTRDLLLHQTRLAFDVDEEMSLKASLSDVTEEAANWQPQGMDKTIADIVWHVAWAKLWYCEQAFGEVPISLDEPASYAEKMERLDQAQDHLLRCLEGCSEQWLANPVPTKFHNASAAHLFTILAIHDVSHGATIRARKRLYTAAAANHRVEPTQETRGSR